MRYSRIAMARRAFDTLAHTWTHSALTWKQKLRTYVSLVESKLLYSMATLVLTVAQRRRLNGFQSRCLRKMVGAQPSNISRVSNAIVLAKAAHTAASDLLRKRQLQLFGRYCVLMASTRSSAPVSFRTHLYPSQSNTCAGLVDLARSGSESSCRRRSHYLATCLQPMRRHSANQLGMDGLQRSLVSETVVRMVEPGPKPRCITKRGSKF